ILLHHTAATQIYPLSLHDALPIWLKNRVIVDKGPVGAAVARGEAELGAQLLCELAPVPGIDIVGPLPDEVQGSVAFAGAVMAARSEEHTSELQSRSDLVCRLLLEK